MNDILKNIKGMFLLTINDHPRIRGLYKGFNIVETRVGYFVSRERKGRKKYGELIIMNY